MKIKKPEFFTRAEKKLKSFTQKMSFFLNDKLVNRFTLSIKFHRDGLSEPITISMQGERTADGNWNKFSLGDKKSGVPRSREALKEQLASIEQRVSKYVVDNALDARWKECEALIKEKLKSGLSVEDLEYERAIPIYAYAVYGYEAHFYAPITATAYAIEATEAFVNDDLDRVSHCVDRGLYWSNPDMLVANPTDRFTKRASEGGKGKHGVYEPVKDKVAELLIKLAPEEGWKSTSVAIETVSNVLISRLSSFVEECGLSTDDMSLRIEDWIHAEPERFSYRIKSKN